MTQLDDLKYQLHRFCHDDQGLKTATNVLIEVLEDRNKNNLENIIPSRHVEINSRCFDFEEEYEDIEYTYEYRFVDPETGDETNYLREELERQIEAAEDAVNSFKEGTKKYKLAAARLEALEDALENNGEPVQIPMSWMFQFNDEVDVELAHSIPNLGTLTYKGDLWVGLTGGGTDLGACYACYIAIKYKGLPSEYRHRFTSPSKLEEVESVVGRRTLKRTLEAMGVYDQAAKIMDDYRAQKAAERKAREARERKRVKFLKQPKPRPLLDYLQKYYDTVNPSARTKEVLAQCMVDHVLSGKELVKYKQVLEAWASAVPPYEFLFETLEIPKDAADAKWTELAEKAEALLTPEIIAQLEPIVAQHPYITFKEVKYQATCQGELYTACDILSRFFGRVHVFIKPKSSPS